MFDRILLAVDGSAASRRATAVALDVASACGATVDVLYVEERAARGDDRDGGDPLEDAAGRLSAADVAVETHRVEGRPHEAVAAFATERGADLVVMGRHGRTGVGERLLGTVAERVLRNCAVPVLTVPAGDGTDDTWDRVLLPTDGSEHAEAAAPYGVELARRLGAALHLLTVVDVRAEGGLFSAGGVSDDYVERLEERAGEAVERLAGRVSDRGAGVDVRTAVVRGTPHEGIREYVADNDVDLVVISSRGTSNVAGHLLGSVADRVLRVVDVPVLVVTDTG